MPRSHPGIKQLGPNLWEVRIQARSRKTGRKTGRQERFEGTFRAAKARQAELRAELVRGGAGPKKRRETLKTFARSWLASRVADLKPSVGTRYASDLEIHILPVLGDYFLDALEPTDVGALISNATVKQQGKKFGQPLKGNSKRNLLRLLRLIAAASVAAGHAARDWTAGLKLPTPEGYTDENPNLLTADQLAALLAAIPRQWLAMVVLKAYTGLRWGELSGLHWEDLDLERGLIRIRRSNWRGLEVAPKTKSSKRPVPLPARFIELVGSAKPRGLIFPVSNHGHGKHRPGESHRGTPLTKVLDKACAAAGVPRITPHGLRRTFNDLGRGFVDRLIMKAMVGHTTDAMNEHYSHVRVEEMAAAQRAVIERVEGRALPAPIEDVARACHAAYVKVAGGPDWDGLPDHEREGWLAAAATTRAA